MRKDVAVLMVLWVMCIPYATFICASATPNKLDTLKAFQQKIVLILAYRYSVKQPLVEISCQEIHIFIACLIHQIEQAGLNRLTVVFLSHLIL